MGPRVTEYTLKNRYVQISLHVLSISKHKPMFSVSSTQQMHSGFSCYSSYWKLLSNTFTLPESMKGSTAAACLNTATRPLIVMLYIQYTIWNHITAKILLAWLITEIEFHCFLQNKNHNSQSSYWLFPNSCLWQLSKFHLLMKTM